MSLDLQQIRFKVETSELEQAVKKIEALGSTVQGLATSIGKLDKETVAAAKSQAQANVVNAKAEVIQAKANTENAKAALVQSKVNTENTKAALIQEKVNDSLEKTNKTVAQSNLINAKAATEAAKVATENAKAQAIATKALEATEAANRRLTKVVKEKQTVEERQAAITRNMSDGYSRGQASILATAEAAGEATVRLGELLKTQRAMQGVDPFDRSIGAATLFENRTRVLTVANDLYQQSLGFTKDQLMELGREHVRLSEQFKVQGKDMGGVDAEFQKIVQSAQQVTQSENAMATSMKNADKATMDAGKANAYIENELQKVRFALQSTNEELNRSTSNSLVRFENALKKSGLTLDQQKLKINEYRKAQIELQKTQKSNQTDYITRAVGPQITDIIVGLSTGQSPLTVMMQQGGQLRDQFGMMGIAAKDMGDVMRNAMKGMAQSVFDTGKAIGSMLVGGIYDAGKAVVNFGLEVTRINSVMDYFKQKIAAQGEEGFKYIGMLNRAGAVVTGVFAVGIAAGVLSVLALGVAFVQVTKAQDDLTKSLVSSGAQLGLSSTEAINLAESLGNVGATSVEILTAFKQMTDSGNISRESLVAVAEAALLLESAGGKAASKTIEMFAKLADKPMETLSEYAQKTGLVDQAEIARIETLVKLGNEITATEEATKILSKATEDEAAIMLASLSDVSRLWLTVKGGISNAWRAVQEFAGSAEIMSGVKVVLQTVAVIATEVWYGIKGIGESLGGLGAIAAAVMTDIKNLDTNFTASKGMMGLIEQQDKARAASYNDSIARIMQEGKYSREELNKTAALAATGRKATADAEKDRVAHELAMKPWREQEQKSLADNLTKQEFIKQAIDKTNKALTKGKTLRAEEIAQITKLAGADWDKSNKPKKAKLSDEQKKENKALEDYIDLMNKAVGLNKDYNNILDGLQFRKKNGKLTEEEYVKAVEELIKQQKFYTDGLAEEEKAQKAAQKAAADHMKLVEEFTKIQDEFTATSLKNQEGIQQENSALSLRVALLGKTEEEQKKINESYKVQGEISKINAKYDKERLELQQKYLKLQADGFDVDYDVWNKQIQQSVQQQGDEAKLVWAGVAMSAAESIQKEFDAIKSSITDSIVTALFDGGKAGSKKLRDQVVQAFRNKITVVIDTVVNTALTELFSGANGGASGGSGAGSSGSGLMSALSTGKSFVDALSGSMNTAIATSFGKFASTGMGQSLGLSTSVGVHGPVTAAGVSPTMLTSTGTMLQGAMASAAGIAAGLALNKALSGGYSVGKGMDNWQKVGTVIAGAINPALGAIVGAIGGLVNRAFGRKLTETGIQGTFGGDQGFTGKNYKFEEGGWFRSDKTSTSAMDEGVRQGLASQFNLIKSSVGFMAATLGQGTDAIASFTAELKVNFKDLSEEEAAKKLQDEFDKIGETLAGVALGTTEYNRTGETNLETLIRLHTSLLTVNAAMSVMDGYLFDVSLSGANASQFLVDLMGGVDGFTKTIGDYYNNFYTEEERTATATKNLTADFAKLGYILPEISESSRKWFKAEEKRLGAMDLSVQANAENYASFMRLQDGLNKLAPTLDEITEAQKALLDTNQEWTDNLNILKGTETERSIALRDALSDTTREIMRQVYTQEDLNESNKKLAEAQKEITESNQQWTDKLNILKGTETERSIALRDALSDTTREIMRQVYAQEDLKEITESITTAYGALLDAQLKLAQDKAQSSYDILERSVEKEKKLLTDTYDTRLKELTESQEKYVKTTSNSLDIVSNSVSRLKNLSEKLKSALDKMNIIDSQDKQRSLSQQLIKEVLGVAKTSGTLPLDTKYLEDALSIVSEPSEELFASFTDYARDFYKTKNDVTELSKLTDTGLTEQEKLLNELKEMTKEISDGFDKQSKDIKALKLKYEENVKSLDETLKTAKAQLDALNDIDNSVMSVAAAVTHFGLTLSSALGVKSQVTTDKATQEQVKVDATKPLTVSERDEVINQAKIMASQLGILPEEALYSYATSQGISPEQLDKLMGFTAGTTKDWAVSKGYIAAAPVAPVAPVSTAPPSSPVSNSSGGQTTTVVSEYQRRIDEEPAYNAENAASITAQAVAGATAQGISPELYLYNYAKSVGYNAGMLDKRMGWAIGSTNNWALSNGLPTFANGGSYGGGLALVGEEGPELINFSNPGQVYTAPQTQNLLGGGDNSRMELLLVNLNENITGLRYEIRADVSHNSNISKLLNRVSPDGQTLAVSFIEPQEVNVV